MSDVIMPNVDVHLAAIANQFDDEGQVLSITPLGSGNINDTYLVTTQTTRPRKFVLQRINQQVFREPHQVMNNICRIEDHVYKRLSIQKTTYDQIESTDLAYEVGVGLGTFHYLIHDLPLEGLVDTLEGFHITPNYLAQYEQVCAQRVIPQDSMAQYCAQFICDRRNLAPILETAKAQKTLKLQPIHGDPKVNNVMIDIQTGLAVSLIDLDTVKPGLIHYDIGDCLRSGCNPLGEETQHFNDVTFDLDLCQAILRGYQRAATDFLSSQDYDYLFDSMRLLAFELGLRFFSDFLNDNQYFKAQYQTHNLNRAVVQFKLAESIEAQEREIKALVNQLR